MALTLPPHEPDRNVTDITGHAATQQGVGLGQVPKVLAGEEGGNRPNHWRFRRPEHLRKYLKYISLRQRGRTRWRLSRAPSNRGGPARERGAARMIANPRPFPEQPVPGADQRKGGSPGSGFPADEYGTR